MGLVLFILLFCIPMHFLSGYVSTGILYDVTGFCGKEWTVACMILGLPGIMLQLLIYFVLILFACY